jgi:hypothetical protein
MNNRRILRSVFVSSRSLLGFYLAAALVVLFTTAFASASAPQGTFERTLQVSGPVDLEVLTHSGDVTIRAGSSGSVLIRGKIFVGDRWLRGNRQGDVEEIKQHPPIRQDGNNIRIDYVNVRDISVDYDITVPTDTAIRAHSGSGDQIVEGTQGNVNVQTGSGDVKLRNLTGEVRLQTGSGDVRAREIAGALKGGAGSGDIDVQESGPGDIDLRTGSGNITVRGIHGAFHGETGSGDINAEGTQSGSWQIRTGSGNVRLRLPADAAFDADISTSSGSVDVGAPIEMTAQGRIQETRKAIRGKVRGGGPLLEVRTGSGDIQIQ